jgi:hypothetical protein
MRCVVFLLILSLAACNLSTEEATTPAPLSEANATVELIQDATNTPNALPTATAIVRPIPLSQTITGIVWNDVCDAPEDADEAPLGCVESDDGYVANGILEAGESGIAGLRVTLGEGVCPSDGLAETTTDANGQYFFSDLNSETYCVTINTLSPENLTVLAPGMWTTPNEQGELSITLTAGESKLDANFGWDARFNP